MIRTHILVHMMLLCLLGQGCAEEKKAASIPAGETDKPRHELYLKWHEQCLSGEAADIDAQIGRYEARLAKDPDDQLARVYLGSACAQRAKASFWGPTKLKYLKRGQSLMDQAVEAAPAHARVRMVRAIGCYKVPKRFNRRKTAVADFEKLLPIAAEDSSGLEINERQAILHYAWLTFKEEGHGDADKARILCRRLAPDSKYGKLTTP